MKDDMIFLSNSIEDSEKDIIGFNTYVEKLNSAIDKNVQMIAITSPFGSGKTSIIELLRKKRATNDNEKFLFVQMWSELNASNIENNTCELHKNLLYQIACGISKRKGTYINRRLSNNYGLLKLHVNRTKYLISLIIAILSSGLGWLIKEQSDIVLKYLPCLEKVIQYLPVLSFIVAIVLLIIVLTGAEIIFSSKQSESQRVVEADEIIDLYRNEIVNKKDEKYIVVIEDLDRTNDGDAVIHFLKELRKYYIISDTINSDNNVVFIVNIKPESILNQETKEKRNKLCKTDIEEEDGHVQETNTITHNEQDSLYAKLFDYVLNLQTINITDYDTILCGLLGENKVYLQTRLLVSPTEKLSDIPGMQWMIRGQHLGIREIKNRLNIASVIFETLRERFPRKLDGIEFQKCAAAAYVMTEFELEFSKTDDKAFEELNKLYLLKNLNFEEAKKVLFVNNDKYISTIVELVEAKLISEDYRMYYYNYPKNSVIYNGDETNIQNAILYGTPCKHFELVAKKVVDSNSDIVEKTINKVKQLGLPLPQIVIKNESLFLNALKHEYSYVLETLNKIKDTDATLNKNITNIIDILKYDKDRNIYTSKTISDFCGCWENVFEESHLVSLREAICTFFGKEIQMYKQLFLGEHSAITTKEMSLLSFQDALELLNVESKNFSVSHLKYIVNRYKEEAETRELVANKICEILIYACNVFASKEIVEDILEYMFVSGEVIEELEETVWELLKEEPIDTESDEEESGITFERQNEIFQKYKQVINSVPVNNISESVLKHINAVDDFDNPYDYTTEISDWLFEHGYHFMSVLVKLNSDSSIDFSNENIVKGIRENCSWAEKHKKIFLELRKKILLCAENIFDYQFYFSSAFPLMTKEEFLLLTNNKNVTILNVLTFFSSDIINDEAVEYISKYFNKKFINHPEAAKALLALAKYSSEIVKSFFEKIDFSHAFLYYKFARSNKNKIKNEFYELLELDTYEGKLKFMENTKFLDEKFEDELVGNTDENMENRYAKLVNRRLAPNVIGSSTIEMLKSFNSYYSFSNYSGVNEKLFEHEEYEYYVVSTTQYSKKFVMETGERLEKIWPTYIEIFTNPSRLSQTVSYMRANEEFLGKVMTSGIYTDFSENAIEQLSSIAQDAQLVEHIFSRGSVFAIKYFTAMKFGFVDDKAAGKYIELLGLESNKQILKSDAVRNNIYDKLVDPVLKRKYTNLRKNNGYEQ